MEKGRTYNLPAGTIVGFPVYGNVVAGENGLAVRIGQKGAQKYWAVVTGECHAPNGKRVDIGYKGFPVNSSFENMLKQLSKLKR